MKDIKKYSEQVRARTHISLINALARAQDAANDKPTMENLRVLEMARTRLREYESDQAGDGFDTMTAVHDYLTGRGFKCALSTISNHVTSGKLTRGDAGRFFRRTVDRYADKYLRRIAAGAVPADEDADVDTKKKAAEARKAEAQAVHWELKSALERGDVVPRGEVEHALAVRAAVFRADIENGMRRMAPEIVALVEGDEKKVPDLVALLLNHADDWLDRYAADPEETKG